MPRVPRLKKSSKPDIYLALLHYPVVNKRGKVIASAVTNLDLHDMARSARTYGVNAFYVVTPLDDQKALAAKLVDHWVNGGGARYNPKRCEALQLIHIRERRLIHRECPPSASVLRIQRRSAPLIWPSM